MKILIGSFWPMSAAISRLLTRETPMKCDLLCTAIHSSRWFRIEIAASVAGFPGWRGDGRGNQSGSADRAGYSLGRAA